MKYYMINEDKSIANRPTLIDWYNKIDVKNLHPGLYSNIDEKIMIYVKSEPQIVFPNIVAHPFIMLNQDMKKVLDKYEPNMGYLKIFFVDKKTGAYEYYSLPMLTEVACNMEKSKFNLDKSVVYELVLNKNEIPRGIPMFAIEGLNTHAIVVRMDLMESLLRESGKGDGFIGITLSKVNII